MRIFRSSRFREAGVALTFLLPSLAGVCVLNLIPMADTVRRSFLSMTGEWRGLANYQALFQNASFLLASLNTIRFLAASVPPLLVLSLGAALMARRAPAFFKTGLLVPLALPVASLALLWQVLFSSRGALNGVLTGLGVPGVAFMDSGAAFWVLVTSYLWKNVGYGMVLLLSGLMDIPQSQYEAARMDGAGSVRSFFAITQPNLWPTVFITAVLSLLNAFKVFREAYLVAGNYPHESMYLLQHLFNNWFLRLDIDKMCTAATLVALVMMLLILALKRLWGESRA
jgi:multiple sugar transport system permease protein